MLQGISIVRSQLSGCDEVVLEDEAYNSKPLWKIPGDLVFLKQTRCLSCGWEETTMYGMYTRYDMKIQYMHQIY